MAKLFKVHTTENPGGEMKPQIEKRSVYSYGRRKHSVWDARCGEACDCRVEAPDKKTAKSELEAEHEYINSAPSLERGGCKLFAVGRNFWSFGLSKRSFMIFEAPTFEDAYAIVAAKDCYGEHPDCVAFFQPEVTP